jgi:hypothetical protein
VIRQRFVEIAAQKPPDAQAVRCHPHKPTLRADVLKEHRPLQVKEDHRVNAWTSRAGVAILHEVPDEREVQFLIQTAVEVVLWDELFKREISR